MSFFSPLSSSLTNVKQMLTLVNLMKLYFVFFCKCDLYTHCNNTIFLIILFLLKRIIFYFSNSFSIISPRTFKGKPPIKCHQTRQILTEFSAFFLFLHTNRI